jgi:lactate dehydrogenase-like 2-hydroxyacid dehydrogenase
LCHGLQFIQHIRLDELAHESGVLFMLAPDRDKTHHIINRDFLKKMKKHAVLVNVACGTLVDSDVLAEALWEEWIWGATSKW